MAALLDAASTGKLWTERSCDDRAKARHAQNDSSTQKAVSYGPLCLLPRTEIN